MHPYVQERGLLVNGTNTVPGQYPFHVRVGCCSGALIAPDIVLSAGHVLPPPDAVAAMKLYVNAYHVVRSENDDQEQGFGVQQAWIHPNYTSIHYDFSLLLMDGMVSDLKPIRLNKDDAIPVPGSDVTLLGTGTFDLKTNERPAVLQSAVTQTVSTDDCRQAYDPLRGISYAGDFIGPTNFCTFSDKDGCVYDSGGPILYQSVHDDDQEDLLVGLISFGVDCADPIYPAVNARVSAGYDWIANLVCEYSRNPPADFACQDRVSFYQTDKVLITNVTKESVNVNPGTRWTDPLHNFSTAVFLMVAFIAATTVFAIVQATRTKHGRECSADSAATPGEQQQLLPTSAR